MPDVKTSTMLWSTQVALVDAQTQPEIGGPVVPKKPYDRAYEFSNGRKFRDRKNPYGEDDQP